MGVPWSHWEFWGVPWVPDLGGGPSCVHRSSDWKRRTGGCGRADLQDPPVTPHPPRSPPRMGLPATAGAPQPLQMVRERIGGGCQALWGV